MTHESTAVGAALRQMLTRRIGRIVLLAALAIGAGAPSAHALPIDFEAVEDLFGTGVEVTNQFAADGVLFENATALTAGISLNEIEFPPRSGATAVFDAGGPMTLTFLTPFYSVEAFFTYLVPVQMFAYDAAGNLLGQTTSGFASNLATDVGGVPNERLALSSTTAIARLVLQGDALGGSFVMDDFNASPDRPTSSVPEPTTALLVGLGLAGAGVVRRFRRG